MRARYLVDGVFILRVRSAQRLPQQYLGFCAVPHARQEQRRRYASRRGKTIEHHKKKKKGAEGRGSRQKHRKSRAGVYTVNARVRQVHKEKKKDGMTRFTRVLHGFGDRSKRVKQATFGTLAIQVQPRTPAQQKKIELFLVLFRGKTYFVLYPPSPPPPLPANPIYKPRGCNKTK